MVLVHVYVYVNPGKSIYYKGKLLITGIMYLPKTHKTLSTARELANTTRTRAEKGK